MLAIKVETPAGNTKRDGCSGAGEVLFYSTLHQRLPFDNSLFKTYGHFSVVVSGTMGMFACAKIRSAYPFYRKKIDLKVYFSTIRSASYDTCYLLGDTFPTRVKNARTSVCMCIFL